MSSDIATERAHAPMLEAAPARLAWIDRARGLGIILVVFGHAVLGLIDANVAPNDPVYRWTVYSIYLFHMPVFFFLAGLVVQSSLNKGPQQFLISKIWTVAYPYVLWSLVQGGLKIVFADNVNSPVHGNLLGHILWDPFDHFWFLYVVMALHLMTVLFGGRRLLLLWLAIATSLLAWIIPDAVWNPDNILHKIARNDIFYAAGVFLAPYLLNRTTPIIKNPMLWAPLIWAAFAVAAYSAGPVTNFSFREPLVFPATCLGVFAFLLTAIGWSGVGGRVLSWLGTASMTIFILHVMASASFRIIVDQFDLALPVELDILFGTLAGLVLPAIVYVVLSKLGWLHWFGFGAPPKAWIPKIASWMSGQKAAPRAPPL